MRNTTYVSSLDRQVEHFIDRYRTAETEMQRISIVNMYEHMININVINPTAKIGYRNYFNEMVGR